MLVFKVLLLPGKGMLTGRGYWSIIKRKPYPQVSDQQGGPMQIWTQASEMAAKTPHQRNRYVDFLRAVSILIVILGHWLITTAYFVDGELTS